MVQRNNYTFTAWYIWYILVSPNRLVKINKIVRYRKFWEILDIYLLTSFWNFEMKIYIFFSSVLFSIYLIIYFRQHAGDKSFILRNIATLKNWIKYFQYQIYFRSGYWWQGSAQDFKIFCPVLTSPVLRREISIFSVLSSPVLGHSVFCE